MRLNLILTPTALLAAAALAGCGAGSDAQPAKQSSASAAKPPVERGGDPAVTLSEWKVATPSPQATAGNVTFDARNTGKTAHELVVIRTDKPAASLGKGARVPEKGNVGETGDLKPGASKKVTLALKPGHYALICNLPGHYMQGMHTDVTVR
jgi:uncharacterized cupredoxin-like copper-binding protein